MKGESRQRGGSCLSRTFLFLRSAAYLQRKSEARQYKLKVERQLVSKAPPVGAQGFPDGFSVPRHYESEFILL